MSRTGRTSTSEPGRNARISLTSTVKPPLTLPVMEPLTISSFSCASSRTAQARARRAFSRDRRVSPKPSSIESRATSTTSPTPTSTSPLSVRNCSIGIAPSDFRPALTMTKSPAMSTTVPIRMEPGFISVLERLSSKSSANDSDMYITTCLKE